MKTKNPIWLIISIFMLVSIACASSASSTPTPTSVFTSLPVIVGGGVNAGSGVGGSGGSGSGSGSGGGNIVISTPVPTSPPTPLPSPDIQSVQYAVQQVESLGHETIAGTVCDVTKPFVVNATAPKVSWTFNFVPKAANNGSLTYAYVISSAGESHDASGSYIISQPGVDGVLTLSMTGSDHVVFKGFDGNIPFRYKFNLVPTQIPNCPVNP